MSEARQARFLTVQVDDDDSVKVGNNSENATLYLVTAIDSTRSH